MRFLFSLVNKERAFRKLDNYIYNSLNNNAIVLNFDEYNYYREQEEPNSVHLSGSILPKIKQQYNREPSKNAYPIDEFMCRMLRANFTYSAYKNTNSSWR